MTAPRQPAWKAFLRIRRTAKLEFFRRGRAEFNLRLDVITTFSVWQSRAWLFVVLLLVIGMCVLIAFAKGLLHRVVTIPIAVDVTVC